MAGTTLCKIPSSSDPKPLRYYSRSSASRKKSETGESNIYETRQPQRHRFRKLQRILPSAVVTSTWILASSIIHSPLTNRTAVSFSEHGTVLKLTVNLGTTRQRRHQMSTIARARTF